MNVSATPHPRDVWPNRVVVVGGDRFRLYDSGAAARISKPRSNDGAVLERFLPMTLAKRVHAAARQAETLKAA